MKNNKLICYDYCIIGGGLAGKYLYSKLKRYNTVFISSSKDTYINQDKNSPYRLDDYLGTKDTWREKATGLITYPDFSKDNLPIDAYTYSNLKEELMNELNISSMKKHIPEDIVEYNNNIAETLNISNPKYFDSTYDCNVGEPIYERSKYDEYWFNKKNLWEHLNDSPQEGYAEYFLLSDNNKAVELIVRDKDLSQRNIRSKKFILACHTAGCINIINRTLLKNIPNNSLIEYSGLGFSDHAQLSFGLCIKNIKMRRDLPPAMIYSDSKYGNIPYRIEIHNGPPLRHHTNYSALKYPEFEKLKESENFIRMSVVLELPSHWNSKIDFSFSSSGNYLVNYKINDVFSNYLKTIKPRIIKHIRERYLTNSNITILNSQDWYFSAHIGGGIFHSKLLNKNLALTFAQNVFVGSLGVMPSMGLYNPTFTLLVLCKYIINSILNHE